MAKVVTKKKNQTSAKATTKAKTTIKVKPTTKAVAKTKATTKAPAKNTDAAKKTLKTENGIAYFWGGLGILLCATGALIVLLWGIGMMLNK